MKLDIPQQKSDADPVCNYDMDIDAGKRARNNQYKDTDPMIEKEGYLGVDDLDKMRRRQVR